MRFLFILGLILFGAKPAPARVGTLLTVTGQTLEGQVRLSPGQVTVVNVAEGWVRSSALSNVASLSFHTNRLVSSDELALTNAPEPWEELDLGAGLTPGGVRQHQDRWTVRGAGRGIGGELDSFRFIYKSVAGNSEIVAEVASIQYTHPYAQAGLMFRESLTEYSRNVTLALTAQSGGGLQWRSAERGLTEFAPRRALYAPYWLKLRRRGTEFTALVSPNGRSWWLLDQITLALSSNLYVGLVVSSARAEVLNWTSFAKVREAAKLVNTDFTPQIELTSGSVLPGRPERAEQGQLYLPAGSRFESVPMDRIARIIYRPLAGDLAWRTKLGRAGLWVHNGDFIDGELRSLNQARLDLSSVLFGLRAFDVGDDVLAAVVQPLRPRRAEFELSLIDGTVLFATSLSLGDGTILVREAALGEVQIPVTEVVELRRR